jgi:hypothetical protein
MPIRLSQLCLIFGTVAWPLLMYLLLAANPGTVPPPRMISSRDRLIPQRTAPPSDQRGSRVLLGESGAGQRATVFWDTPEPGRVHVRIEIEPVGPVQPPTHSRP